MAEVVYLFDGNTIPPKSHTDTHLHHRFVCTFDPNASADKRWVWVVSFTRVYKYYGATVSLARAQQQARAQIKKLVNAEHRAEENE